MRKRKPKVNDDINAEKSQWWACKGNGEEEPLFLQRSIIMQRVDDEGKIENQPNKDIIYRILLLKIQKRIYHIYVRYLDFDYDDST